MLMIAIVMCSVLLFLTQSRGAIFAVLGGILFLSALQTRMLPRLIVGAAILALIVFVVRVGFAGVDDIVAPGGPPTGNSTKSVGSSILDRVTIWQSAAELIHRYPLSGVGLSMFSIVARQLVDPEMAQQTTHAHNLLIQSAMDFGLPGLTAYAAMLICAFGLLFPVLRAQPRSSNRYAIALALVCGLLANQLFGFTDAIPFGQKPGFVFWIFLGLAAHLSNREPASAHEDGIHA
jgi:putative inorganic carbon (hco3(-)) transporter